MPGSGLGVSAIGSAPFGVGTPATAVAPPTGKPTGAAFISGLGRDYEIDGDTTELKRMPVLRQRVRNALAQSFGSSTTRPTDGLRWPKRGGLQAPQKIDIAVRTALRYLTDVEKVLRVDQVLSDLTGVRPLVTILYTDLSTRTADTVTV